MKSIVLLICLISLLIVFKTNSSTAKINNVEKNSFSDSNCVCGIYYDSTGIYNNLYGLNCGFGWGRFVMKLTPISYPYTVNRVCIALSRTSSGSQNWSFNINIFDTTGFEGGPGTLIDSFPMVATPIPIWPGVKFFNFDVSGIPALTHGSYYIGIGYDPCAELGKSIAAVESGAPLHPGYCYIQGTWTKIQYVFPGYKVLGIRAEQYPNGIIKTNNKIPEKFILYNNYPNPFNAVCFIKFDLPKSAEVKLTLYNAAGAEIDVLINGYYGAGSYRISWDGVNFPSGLYFYRIEAGDYIETKKMILLK